MRIILLEAAIVAGLAGILGYLVGFSATKMLIPLFTEGHGAAVPFDPLIAAGALVLSLILGLAASSYPAFTASRLDPNEALRAL